MGVEARLDWEVDDHARNDALLLAAATTKVAATHKQWCKSREELRMKGWCIGGRRKDRERVEIR